MHDYIQPQRNILPVPSTISRRDWFAASAPEVPKWFEWQPADPMPIMPSARDRLNDEQRQQWDGLDDWIGDENVDKVVLEFRDDFYMAKSARKAWHDRQSIGREIAWRWYWADQMLAMSEQSV